MSVLDQANEKRREAIELLVSERQKIDGLLNQLGYDGEEVKKSGHKKCSRCGQEGHSIRTCMANLSESTH